MYNTNPIRPNGEVNGNGLKGVDHRLRLTECPVDLGKSPSQAGHWGEIRNRSLIPSDPNLHSAERTPITLTPLWFRLVFLQPLSRSGKEHLPNTHPKLLAGEVG